MNNEKLSTIHLETDLDCKVFLYDKELTTVYSGRYSIIKLPLGNHKLSFIGIENTNDRYDIVHTVNNIDFEDFISIRLKRKYNERKTLESQNKEKYESKIRREELFCNLKRLIKNPLFKVGCIVIFIAMFIISIVVKTDMIYGTYSEGYIPAAEVNIWGGNAKWGYINDWSSHLVIPYKYNDASDFSEGLAAVKYHRKWGFINKSGKVIIPYKYKSVESFQNGLAAVFLDGKWGWIDRSGKEVIPLKYEGFRYLSDGPWKDDLAIVQFDGKYGYINNKGIEVSSIKYDDIHFFSEGLSAVKFNGKWGYINIKGDEVIPIIYESAGYFENGVAEVQLNNRTFHIDNTGKEFIPKKVVINLKKR